MLFCISDIELYTVPGALQRGGLKGQLARPNAARGAPIQVTIIFVIYCICTFTMINKINNNTTSINNSSLCIFPFLMQWPA